MVSLHDPPCPLPHLFTSFGIIEKSDNLLGERIQVQVGNRDTRTLVGEFTSPSGASEADHRHPMGGGL
ncbi:MAG: hypothetical protein BWY86_01055 [Candidatus Aminicenantes bacterium ADurb.Bin508]|nr:MAG: hypothetical protein BWY86_01055 [Candidatus Aminicenantes bacterium ADurb.Bin508]